MSRVNDSEEELVEKNVRKVGTKDLCEMGKRSGKIEWRMKSYMNCQLSIRGLWVSTIVKKGDMGIGSVNLWTKAWWHDLRINKSLVGMCEGWGWAITTLK